MEEGTAELNWVYVRPEHRRRGCARQVVEVLELQALFQGFGRMVMEIGQDIPEAISLYRKMGYREIETLTIFADNKDTLCMEKGAAVSGGVQGGRPWRGKECWNGLPAIGR